MSVQQKQFHDLHPPALSAENTTPSSETKLFNETISALDKFFTDFRDIYSQGIAKGEYRLCVVSVVGMIGLAGVITGIALLTIGINTANPFLMAAGLPLLFVAGFTTLMSSIYLAEIVTKSQAQVEA